jgi:DNA-binding IscR family transcriptional regulator
MYSINKKAGYMQIGTKFSVAIHILLCAEVFKDNHKVTSELIASSAKTNPVIIRKIMGQLREAGIIEVTPGTGGIALKEKPAKVTLLDVFRAVEPIKDGELFKIHGNTEKKCPVGKNIGKVLPVYFQGAQDAMEKYLAKVTIQTLLNDLGKPKK